MLSQIRPDDPRILNLTFSFYFPWGDEENENIVNVEDDDIFIYKTKW